MAQKYRHKITSVSLINYHFVWIARRRRKVLDGKIAERLSQLIAEVVAKLDCQIIAQEIMPDHVHLFLNCPTNISPDQIMFRIKGYSSRVLRMEFPVLARMPSMWTRTYFISTASNVSSETIKRYIENQKST
ncbi:MAG: IS200/IS605 family transposase [Acidobacteria bacterium]|nr:IS200/IS605 family transposase [Acidobacteriota bacterium]